MSQSPKSDTETPVPEVPAPTAPEAAAVPESGAESIAHESPPTQSTPPPESSIPEPFWASRRYLKRSFGFTFNNVFIQGTYRQLPDGQIDIDGLYGERDYQSTDELIRLAAPTHEQAQALVTKVREVLARR